MSLHLYAVTGTSSNSTQRLRLLVGYENGGVALWSFDETLHGKPTTVEGNGWEALWQVKAHEESSRSPMTFAELGLLSSA